MSSVSIKKIARGVIKNASLNSKSKNKNVINYIMIPLTRSEVKYSSTIYKSVKAHDFKFLNNHRNSNKLVLLHYLKLLVYLNMMFI